MAEWREDPVAAAMHAQTTPMRVDLPRHHYRCDWMLEGERCAKAQGHQGDHEVAKEKK